MTLGRYFLFLILTTIISAQMLNGQGYQKYRWKNRLVLLYAGSESDVQVAEFLDQWEAESDRVNDRDLLLYVFRPDRGQDPSGAILPIVEVEAFLQRFQPKESGLTWFLIGKDGGVKMDGQSQPPLSDIFGRIDQMPMRMQEMKKGNE